ncbi:hypothetical protein [Porphyromonas uenonis]|uniref:hypothetical protein n=1 Tax=Porphyromonas uenonis TaxID=281920 RepID=UPI0026F2B94C|nr:hypothetical protein [Porphyromonas uenonis]
MRSRIHNILLLAGLLFSAVALTGCGRSPLEGSDEELTLLIRFSPIHPFRAVEDGDKGNSYTVDTYTPITLFFYDAHGNPTEPYRVELKSQDDINKAMGMDGYEIKVREAVSKVSAVAGVEGIIKPDELGTREIYNLQGLKGADETQKGGFLYKVPYVAPKTDIKPDQTDPNKLTVTLQPVPNVARLEISGEIKVPFESTQPAVNYIIKKFMKSYSANQTDYSWLPTPQDVTLRTISDVTIRGIYLNNYKETPNVANDKRTCLTDENWSTNQWSNHNVAMHTLFEGASYATAMNEKKVDAYQIYPGGTTADKAEALDHIIVKVEYKVRTQVGHFNYKVYNATEGKDVYACTGVKDLDVQTRTRFITIRKFRVTDTNQSLVSFDPGKIYRIDLSYLSSLFSTNAKPGIKTTNDITEITPRPERTDERPEETTNTIPVSVVDWTHININTELD